MDYALQSPCLFGVILSEVNFMSVENTTIQAELRETSSKGEIKKGRVNGLIPAVLYGKGKPTLISIARSNLPKKHTNSGLVNLVVNGSEKLAIMREVQVSYE